MIELTRPKVKDFIKGNDIMVGNFKVACEDYAGQLLLYKGGKTNKPFPDVLHYVNGSGVTQKALYVKAVEQYMDEVEATIYTKKSKAEQIAELERQIAEIEEEHEGNWQLVKISSNGGSGTIHEILAMSENQQWLINFCEQTYSYSPTLDGNRPEGDTNYLSPYYTIEETPVVIILQDRNVGFIKK